MAGFTKLFASITDSTIWQAPDTTRIVWITMLAMADQNGYVGASVPGLAARARVSMSDCIAALDTLRSPDEWSRTKDFEGRRITDADGGWRLLNHAKYRAKLDAVDRREQARVAMAKLRASRKQALTVNRVNTGSVSLTQAEAEAEATKTPLPPNGGNASRFEKFWKAYPAKIGKIAAQKAFEKHRPDDALLDAMLSALEAQRRSDKWQKDGGQYIPNPATWLNQGRWQDDVGGVMDAIAEPWHKTLGGVKKRGAELGIPYTSEDECKPFFEYQLRVLDANAAKT